MLSYFLDLVEIDRMEQWDTVFVNANLATMQTKGVAYGIVENAALAIVEDRIAWFGKHSDIPPYSAVHTQDMDGKWITPALIDCHTHLIFGGDRAEEFEQRLQGISYAEIARAGGGIQSTVKATRGADINQLVNEATSRVQGLMHEGVSTIEVKSGYGLDLDTELTMLQAARLINQQSPINITATFLGAHAIPTEYRSKADQYIDLIVNDVLPQVHLLKLADAVDAYCESIAFSVQQVSRVFEQSCALGIPVKLHADQLSECGGAELAAEFNALSADHLEYSSAAGVRALAEAGTTAVLLPGPFLVLGETQLPPISLLREMEVPIAIGTDCNPGSSPLCSLRLAMNLASNLFKLTPEECLVGVTRAAAQALGLDDEIGTITTGKRADLALWNIHHPRELTYWAGVNQLDSLYIRGLPVL